MNPVQDALTVGADEILVDPRARLAIELQALAGCSVKGVGVLGTGAGDVSRRHGVQAQHIGGQARLPDLKPEGIAGLGEALPDDLEHIRAGLGQVDGSRIILGVTLKAGSLVVGGEKYVIGPVRRLV